MTWIDTHAHLDDARFAADLPAVLATANAAGVARIVTIGIDLETSRSAVRLAESHPALAAAVGLHPNHVAEAAAGDIDAIAELAAHPLVVAVGETGLDRHWDRTPFDAQLAAFRRHLDLARRLGKPIVIHCRDAEADMVRVVQAEFEAYGPVAGVMHSFCGDPAQTLACLACGLHVSFAGMLTYKSADAVRAAAAVVPLDRLLVETDCPYLTPVPHRGKRNEPAFVTHTGAELARVQGVSVEQLAAATTANARRLFALGGE